MARFKQPKEPVAQAPVLVAAASNLRVATYRDALLVSLQRQPWQYRALDMYEDEGHAHYAASYIGNAMSRIRLIAAKKPTDPRETPVEVTEGPVYEAVQQLASGRGGQKGLLRLLGVHLFLVGECWLVGTLMPTGVPRWEVLSIQELVVTPGDPLNLYRKRLPGSTPDLLPHDALVMRIWRENPRYSELADSGFRPLLDLLEKILMLNRAEKAAARSRSASMGLLAIPQELIPPGWQNQDATADPAQSNPFMTAFTEAMLAPLKDEGHPGSVVPIVLIGPGEMVNKIKFEPMNRPFETGIRQSIEDAIHQVAHGLDIPSEILTGLGKSTHWTAWQIKEDTFQAHIQPLIELLVDALTVAYLRPAIERARGALIAAGENPEDLDQYIVWYDTRELVIRPDKGDKAIALHDRFTISNEALRRETGFLESDKPDEKEYAKRVGIKLLDAHMAITGETPPDQIGLMKKQALVQNKQAEAQMKMQQDAQAEQMQQQADLQAQQQEQATPLTPADQQNDTTTPPPEPNGGGAVNPPQAPAGAAAVEAPGPVGRPRETAQADGFHTPKGPRSKPRPQAESRRKKPGPATPSKVSPPVTASAAPERRLAVNGTFSHRLGVIDVQTMKKVQKLANDAVRHAIDTHQVTAGASAQDLIGDSEFFVDNAAAVEEVLYGAYGQSFNELNDELGSQGLALFDVEVAAGSIGAYIDAAIGFYRTTLNRMINDRLFTALAPVATSIPQSVDLVQPGDIRQVVQVAGGGGVSADVSRYTGGISTGIFMQGILSQAGAPLEGWLWLYDPGWIRQTFQGHRQLDGLVFERFDDEQLTVKSQDYWLRVPFYFPGDHSGCACAVVPWTGPDWTGGHEVVV